MTVFEPPSPKRRGPRLTSEEAQARLADALRENLRRRKSQMRAKDNKHDNAAEAPSKAAPDPADKGKSE